MPGITLHGIELLRLSGTRPQKANHVQMSFSWCEHGLSTSFVGGKMEYLALIVTCNPCINIVL